MKGIVVCVQYDDILLQTLAPNMRHMTECLVVSSPDDKKTAAVVASVPGARLFITDAFYRNGAKFNKGAALEEGFNALGRDGWILIFDADILLPDHLPGPNILDLNPNFLYGAKRRLLLDVKQWPYEQPWNTLPLSRESGWPGYFQLFHGGCQRLKVRPWYAVHSPHAAIGDAHFQGHWPQAEKGYLPCEVLHFGPRDQNWFGRASERMDGEQPLLTEPEVANLFKQHRWNRPGPRQDHLIEKGK